MQIRSSLSGLVLVCGDGTPITFMMSKERYSRGRSSPHEARGSMQTVSAWRKRRTQCCCSRFEWVGRWHDECSSMFCSTPQRFFKTTTLLDSQEPGHVDLRKFKDGSGLQGFQSVDRGLSCMLNLCEGGGHLSKNPEPHTLGND